MVADRVGFIGLGCMGGGMALNLASRVPELLVFDQSSDAMRPLLEAGAKVADSARQVLLECDLIFLCLPSTPQVESVLFGDQALESGNSQTRSRLIVDTTTLDRLDAIALHQRAAEFGVDYADCPISGLPARAANGTLTMMFGGDRPAFDRVQPLLDSMGNDIRYCGAIGNGQAMKAINNIIYNINIVALCEVLPLATAIGLDPEEVAGVVRSGSSRSFASEHFVSRMLNREFHSDFSLRNAYKDILNVQGMAMETRAMTPVINAMTATYQAAIAAGFGDEPKSAMLKVYENALETEFSTASPD